MRARLLLPVREAHQGSVATAAAILRITKAAVGAPGGRCASLLLHIVM